jgi:hypothetical protein
MLKVLLLIDCDECGHPLSQATVCSVHDPMVWEASIEDLVYEATGQGWDFYMKHYRCPACSYRQYLEDQAIQLGTMREDADEHMAG